MIDIRPISDLRYRFTEIETAVKQGNPVYLTKNGYGTMVVLSLETYAQLTDPTEAALDEAERYAETHTDRMTHEKVFDELREHING